MTTPRADRLFCSHLLYLILPPLINLGGKKIVATQHFFESGPRRGPFSGGLAFAFDFVKSKRQERGMLNLGVGHAEQDIRAIPTLDLRVISRIVGDAGPARTAGVGREAQASQHESELESFEHGLLCESPLEQLGQFSDRISKAWQP